MKYTLHYFDIEGRAESIRLTFTLAGIEFEDHRFGSRDEFKAMKESGKFLFGQVPALEVTDDAGTTTMLNQTAALMRFVGKGTTLYPSHAVLATKVDAIVDQRSDAYAGLSVAKYQDRFGFGFIKDTEMADTAKKNWNTDIMPKHLTMLANLLDVGGTGWLAGTPEPSIADALWAPDLKALNEGKSSGDDTVLKAFPTLIDFLKRFYALPAIKAYYGDELVK
mmetsp:Transcript_36548/g.117197  ORF Transcript_36548/g.117197 Transcript_36548/m.117197 type:complete len:222 (+) Transcript_36548:93-758(+)|eukprot:CAMPEP_0118910474 /NCGR_PEP_ID=MMETSP1166-20130328/12599_1 /TAXON_ID=1104430 /ORGANISM="Chrysoreinhardia sp, Strain CCMP3193" /LENGTH=221 /DNA_ID=CAMNT_0006849941 /DNA_START=30 /DNA_END=695 /DNA_ORIENTATION=-